MENGKSGCGCACHKILGFIIILMGIVFLMGHFNIIGPDTVGIMWPVLLILAGVKKAYGNSCKCCSGSSK